MNPEIPNSVLTDEIGPQSSGGAGANKTESSCATDELLSPPFKVHLTLLIIRIRRSLITASAPSMASSRYLSPAYHTILLNIGPRLWLHS